MGRPWRPNCIQVRKKTLNWTFSSPPETVFWTVWARSLTNNHLFFVTFWSRRLDGISLISVRFCNTFDVKSQIPRVCWLSVLCIRHTFFGLLPGTCFVTFWCYLFAYSWCQQFCTQNTSYRWQYILGETYDPIFTAATWMWLQWYTTIPMVVGLLTLKNGLKFFAFA